MSKSDDSGDSAAIEVIANSADNCVSSAYKDSGGDGCSWYEEHTQLCGDYDSNDFYALRDCCECGGGFVNNVEGTECSYNYVFVPNYNADENSSFNYQEGSNFFL